MVWSALTRSNEHAPSVQVRAVFALHLQRASAPLREPRAHRRTGLRWAANPDQARAGQHWQQPAAGARPARKRIADLVDARTEVRKLAPVAKEIPTTAW
ncbi:hypothetical protein Veis_3193 [Verminephrobacter eiseniae EF01-2]|uniref:Uncharacterized protein n=1 Tax=Verminephrobacter eiseniae (strain EF01-2) TaxID=391735 RepID=A1WMR6_VEREI|nr:hypothetical protein Veis_3193 [Verminephrobacter eiseniae EF01-2]